MVSILIEAAEMKCIVCVQEIERKIGTTAQFERMQSKHSVVFHLSEYYS